MKDESLMNGVEFAFHAGAAQADAKNASGEYAVIPDGFRLESLEQFNPNPTRIRSKVQFTEVDSLLNYLEHFKDSGTRIFADRSRLAIVAYLDYHEGAIPQWGEHQATLKLTLSEAWKTWTTHDKRAVGQVAFAEFLEDHYLDIVKPDGADILEAASHLEATKTVNFKSGINLNNGAVQLTYDEAIDGKGKGNIVVPTRFTLGIPIFEDAEPIEVEARLRYRINDSKLMFTYILHQPEQAVKRAFNDILAKLGGTENKNLHLGSVSSL